MEFKPGSRLKSSVCSAEVVVVRPPTGDIVLECGGHPVTPIAEAAPEGLALSADHQGGVAAGKRYVDAESGLELLCSKAGQGSLTANGRPLTLKEAKPLPSSD